MSLHFEHFAAIDWSGAKGPRQRGIAIALCARDEPLPRLEDEGSVWSREDVLDWLLHRMPANTLVGLDLAPGLPFADRGAYFPGWSRSPGNARALWELVDTVAHNDPNLSVSSFVDHPVARHYFRHGGRYCGERFGTGRGRLRATEARQRDIHDLSPYSCFNLVGAAQVGKSSLTGMRVLHRLGGRLPVWPFDDVPASGSVVVEIYTSLAARMSGIPKGRSKMTSAESFQRALNGLGLPQHRPLRHYSDHATDALLTAAWLRAVHGDVALWQPSPGIFPAVRHTEGWTFGVR